MLAQVGSQEMLTGWMMNGMNVSEPKSVAGLGHSFLIWKKQFHLQLTVVFT